MQITIFKQERQLARIAVQQFKQTETDASMLIDTTALQLLNLTTNNQAEFSIKGCCGTLTTSMQISRLTPFSGTKTLMSLHKLKPAVASTTKTTTKKEKDE